MSYSVENHKLYKDNQPVSYKASPNHGGIIEPRIIVCHYTGSDSLQGALSWLTSRESKVSAHFIIAKTGYIWQLLPTNIKAWHAGISNYNGESVGNSVNDFSIGIEHVGIGEAWPDAQLEASGGVIRALFDVYDIEDVVGHMDVAPGRKEDPKDLYFELMIEKGYLKDA